LVTLVEAESPYRSFSLAIALPEAQAMALALQKSDGARPGTHELFTSFIQATKSDVVAVRIVRHENGVFYGEIDLMTPSGHVVLDCRPSDGIIMALRQPVTAPLLCAEEILAELH
jgi:bifunctional DNase/RNase